MHSPSRWNTKGQIVPAFLSVVNRELFLEDLFDLAVNGNDRPSPFFVVPGSSRRLRAFQAMSMTKKTRMKGAAREKGTAVRKFMLPPLGVHGARFARCVVFVAGRTTGSQ